MGKQRDSAGRGRGEEQDQGRNWERQVVDTYNNECVRIHSTFTIGTRQMGQSFHLLCNGYMLIKKCLRVRCVRQLK